MTLYGLIKQISHIITPETDAFYKYVIYTSDDNGGFLRTRFCWLPDKPIKDHELGEGFSTVMVTSKTEIDEKELVDETDTLVKMQIDYSDKNATFEDADWDSQLGYCYVYIFDLERGVYSLDYYENPIISAIKAYKKSEM